MPKKCICQWKKETLCFFIQFYFMGLVQIEQRWTIAYIRLINYILQRQTIIHQDLQGYWAKIEVKFSKRQRQMSARRDVAKSPIININLHDLTNNKLYITHYIINKYANRQNRCCRVSEKPSPVTTPVVVATL